MSLAEALVAASLFLLISGVIVSIFELGIGSFRISALRQDLQSQGRLAVSRLERDLQNSPLESLAVQDGPGRNGQHGVCMAGLADWNDLTAYDPNTGFPRWNRYVLYWSTQEQQEGRLLRVEVEPPPPLSGPWTAFATLSLPEGLPGASLQGLSVTKQQCLSQEVSEFRLSPDDKTLRCTLKLRRREGSRLSGRQTRDEVFQLEMEARPRNGHA